jgi:ankyrin repeat protein
VFPLEAACGVGAIEIVNYLLDIGANVSVGVKSVSHSSVPLSDSSLYDPTQYQMPPLMQAARAGHCEIIKILIARGAQVNVSTQVHPSPLPKFYTSSFYQDGSTALLLACASNHWDCVQELIASGATVHVKNNVWQ